MDTTSASFTSSLNFFSNPAKSSSVSVNPGLLLITGILLIAGIFFIGIQTGQQIQDTKEQLETFSSQVDEEQKTLSEAQSSFAATIQSKKDLFNYYEKKASAKQTIVQEHIDSDESSADAPASVFSQVN